MSGSQLQGEFLRGTKGSIFALLRRPDIVKGDCVLIVPPFAEEMNKSRRMVTELAIGLANRGVATLLPDLYGTGDSDGNFAEADWQTWLQDLSIAIDWAEARGWRSTQLLAVRLGSALALSAIAGGNVPAMRRTVLWQPVFDGSRVLSQFLRLRVAASLMEDRKETLAELRDRLRAGEAVEVAGYSVSSRLAADLDALTVPRELAAAMGAVTWLEAGREADSHLPAPSARLIEQTREKGMAVETQVFAGEPFWSSTEIVVNRNMVDATLERLAPQ